MIDCDEPSKAAPEFQTDCFAYWSATGCYGD